MTRMEDTVVKKQVLHEQELEQKIKRHEEEKERREAKEEDRRKLKLLRTNEDLRKALKNQL